jgi:hypothetical protein
MQRLINRMQDIAWFDQPVNTDIASAEWRAHLDAVRSAGASVPQATEMHWLDGAPGRKVEVDENQELNKRGRWAPWYAALEQLAVLAINRIETTNALDLIGPPLWAFPRRVSVRTEPLLANQRGAVRCAKYQDSSDAQAAWLMLCHAEEVLSSALNWQCAWDGQFVLNPFESLINVYVAGVIPLGWDSSGRSALYRPVKL